MDDDRFDRLARSFGRRVSRRAAARGGVVGAVAALLAVARGREAAARPGSIPLGGACFADRQCDQTFVDAPFRAVCADNGFAYDGPFNCCVAGGNNCGFDEQCCGGFLCIEGACIDYDAYINTLGDTTDDILPGGPPSGFGSLGLGEPCGDPAQCYSGSGLDATCADNGIDYGGVCCTFYGFGCATDRHCCGSLFCGNEVCTVPYEGYG